MSEEHQQSEETRIDPRFFHTAARTVSDLVNSRLRSPTVDEIAEVSAPPERCSVTCAFGRTLLIRFPATRMRGS
jgi:hypothetical protein